MLNKTGNNTTYIFRDSFPPRAFQEIFNCLQILETIGIKFKNIEIGSANRRKTGMQLIPCRNSIEVEVLKTNAKWYGVTYREDKDGVVKKLKEMTESGLYPSPLWKK